jgi:hypothetical protein
MPLKSTPRPGQARQRGPSLVDALEGVRPIRGRFQIAPRPLGETHLQLGHAEMVTDDPRIR